MYTYRDIFLLSFVTADLSMGTSKVKDSQESFGEVRIYAASQNLEIAHKRPRARLTFPASDLFWAALNAAPEDAEQ